jgi:hypothetical protein
MNSKSQIHSKDTTHDSKSLGEVKQEKWGEVPEDNFGYSSDEERRAKRGLEDWELLESVPRSQKGVPKWFVAVIVAVLLVAIGLSFPFWGDRPGYERDWINWGFGAALLYLAVFGAFVYFMVNKYSPSVDGKEEAEPKQQEHAQQKQAQQKQETHGDENAPAQQHTSSAHGGSK